MGRQPVPRWDNGRTTLEAESTVAVEVPPSRVPQRGLPPRAGLAVVVVAVASVAGLAILNKTPVAPAPALLAGGGGRPVAHATLEPDGLAPCGGSDSSALRSPRTSRP